MTYLSRIRINPLRTESRKLLANPRAMHGAVVGGVPDLSDEQRILWRLDSDNPYRPHLLVLTPSVPDWTQLVQDAGWPNADGAHVLTRDYTPLLHQIATGREFAFRLTANPVENTKEPLSLTPAQKTRLAEHEPGKKMRGFRMSHRTAAAQLTWFLKRTERWGFSVPAARTDPPAPGLDASAAPEGEHPREVRITARQRFSFAKKKNGPRVTFHGVTFEGRLTITDTKAFHASLLNGLGPSKAYGCGLLTLAPLSSEER
ncbi:type I-E CRISPR-associated protein Cas6/Cse3/CasE [Streptomyces sp. O3]